MNKLTLPSKSGILWLVIFCWSFHSPLFSNGLNPGEIMFVGFDADFDDGFAFVAFANIPNNTTIYFTDNEWNGMPIGSGGTFNNNEGYISWTNDSGGDILAGSVVSLQIFQPSGTLSSNCGTPAAGTGNFNIATSDEVIYAYCGNNESDPTSFLTAMTNGTFSSHGSITNTGLTEGTTAINILGTDQDVAMYNATITNTTTASDIAAASNWVAQNTPSVDDSTDGVLPDFPDDVPVSYETCEFAQPVSLAFFTAHLIENYSVKLAWATESEDNNDYFSIEHSTDAREFYEIGKVAGSGSTTDLQNYSFMHEDAKSGIHYYRLRQVDFDGAFDFSPIVTVSLHADGDVNIYPTLASEKVLINSNHPFTRNAQFEVFNISGQKVLQNTLPEEDTSFEIDVTTLPTGNYFLRLNLENQLITKRFTKN